jgi:hypothetical protein
MPKARVGIKWSADYERKIHEVMARVLVADARAEVARRKRLAALLGAKKEGG